MSPRNRQGAEELPIGIVLVTPALLKSLAAEGIADKELSALLATDRVIRVTHGTTFDALRDVSPLLAATRSGLSTGDSSIAESPPRSPTRRGRGRHLTVATTLRHPSRRNHTGQTRPTSAAWSTPWPSASLRWSRSSAEHRDLPVRRHDLERDRR